MVHCPLEKQCFQLSALRPCLLPLPLSSQFLCINGTRRQAQDCPRDGRLKSQEPGLLRLEEHSFSCSQLS